MVVQFSAVWNWPFGQDLPDRQRVLDLLQHEAREHREDLHVAAVAELVDVCRAGSVSLSAKSSLSERSPSAA